MAQHVRFHLSVAFAAVACLATSACDNGGVYAPCTADTECTAAGDGEPVCVQADASSFCTWTCSNDEECASSDATLLCASFEENPDTYCFPSCGEDDESCPPGFLCRSTGGGMNQRRVCYPE